MSKKQRRELAAQGGSDEQVKTPQKDSSTRVFQRDKLDFSLNIRQRDDLTENQKKVLELILDRETRVVFLSGPAGTSKTFMAVLAGLMSLNKKGVSDIVYVRSIVESASRSLGYLPGNGSEKMEPYIRPILEKLEEMLPKEQVDRLVKEKRVEAIPVGFLRGASINAKYIVSDESQSMTFKELTTVITRLGKFSKLIIAGDPGQSDIGDASGFMKMYDLFNDEESRANGIHCFSFTADDIVRSGILGYIVRKIEGQPPRDPMFAPS